MAAIVIGTAFAPATDYTWNNTTANWNVGANWTPGGGPPTAADNAFLLGATAYTTTLSDSRAINNLTINNANASLSHAGGTFSVGGTINLAAGTYRLDGGTISGGSIVSTGGTLNLRSNNNNILNNVAVGVGVLDFTTNIGKVRLQGSTSLAAGMVITMGGGGFLAFEQTVTTGNLTVTLVSQSALTVEGNNTLTLGAGTTVTHGSLGTASIAAEMVVAGNTTILNQGLIANTSAGVINITGDTFTNQAGGIVRMLGGAININSGGVINTATGTGGFEVVAGNFNLNGTNWINNGNIRISGGNLNLGGTFTTAGIGIANFTRTGGVVNLTGTLDNTAATLALTASSGSFQLNGSTITGGSISAAGGSTLQIAFNNNNRLNNVAVGLGVLSFGGSGSGSRVRMQGTTSLAAGSVIDLSGGTMAFEQTTTLNNVTLNMTFNAASVSVESTNTLTIGATTIISANNAGTSTNVLLGNQTFVAGANTVLNQGLIRSTGTGIFTISPATLTNQSGGIVQATAGNLTISPTTFTNQSGGIVRATAGNLTINNGGTINAAGGLFDINGGALNLNGTNWNNAGTITLSSGTLNLGGSFVVANIGTVNRTGGNIAITGALDNVPTSLALSASTGNYQLNGGIVNGGSITAAGGATLQPLNNNNNRLNNVALGVGVLDFSAAAGRVRLQGTTSLASGTVINMTATQNILAFEQTATVNNVNINMSGNDMVMTVEGSHILTLGPATTFTHSSGWFGNYLGSQAYVSGSNTLLNQGLIRNTGSGGAIFINPTTFTNQSGGIVRATAGTINLNSSGAINAAGGLFDVNGGTLSLNGTNWVNAGNTTVSSGTLNLAGTFTTAGIGLANLSHTGGAVVIAGAMNNTAATLALTAATGSFQLNTGIITGGAITSAGGATLQPSGNINNRINNVAIGVGVLDFSTVNARVRLQGTTSLASGTVINFTNSSNILAFEQTATVNDVTINLSNAGGGVAVDGVNTLTLGPTTTVTHNSALLGNSLGNQLAVTGANTLLNQGLIHNTGSGIFNIVPTTFTNTGTVRASAGGIAIPTTTNLTNFAGTTLTGGTWEAVGTGNLNFGTRTINTIAAGTTVTLDGAGSVFVAANTVTANAGTFNVLNGRAYTVTGGTLTNSGTVQVGSSATVTGAINTTGTGTVLGSGTVVGNVSFSGTGNTLRPGSSPGILTVTGNLTLNAGTTYVAELNGTTVGTQYDRVTVNGAANVVTLGDATLNVVLGYDPTVNDRLFIVNNQTNNPISGTFAGLPTSGSTFSVTNPNTNNTFIATIFYLGDTSTSAISGGNDVVLVFTPVPEPASLALLALPAAAWWIRRRRIDR